MTTSKLFAWCLLAFAVGLLIGLYLNRPTPPDDRRTKAQPQPGQGGRNITDIFDPAAERAAGQ